MRPLTASAMLCLLHAPLQAATGSCQVVDLMPAYWQALVQADAPARMRAQVIDPHPDLYNDNYVRLPAGAEWVAKLAQERIYPEAHRADVDAAEHFLAANVPGYMRRFQRTFPDYHCDFTFYIAPSFGNMDGAATVVNGKHRIIFAPDVIPRLHRLDDLKILIDHETFHIYHHQVTGEYGVDANAVPTIGAALWSEGLATFASWRMNPGVSLDLALLQPGIPEAARPHLAAIAAELLAHLDERDETTYGRFFEGGKAPAGYPARAGYYVGLVIAQNLSRSRSLTQLAHLRGPELHAALVSELQHLQH